MEKDLAQYGVNSNFQWIIRILTPILLLATLLINATLGMNIGGVSNRFHLWVTPPDSFFFIWNFIYSGLIIANIYNLIKNQWSLKAHIFFGISNLFNISWVIVFIGGQKINAVFSSLLLIGITVFVYLTWVLLGNVPDH